MKQITLKVKDIRKSIAESLGSIMVEDGFEYKKTTNEFICKKNNCTYIYNLLLTSWSTSYWLDVRLWIRQEQIENVYESILGKSHGLTLSQHMLERIFYSPDGRQNGKGNSLTISMVSDDDIFPAIKGLKNYYLEIAKPYFGRFITLEAFDNFINSPPFEYSPAYVGTNTNERCMKGLITAKLVNSSNYNNLITIYDELIKKTLSDVQPDSVMNYNKVKEYLAHNKVFSL